ncbi:hypothetical protein [Kangiella sediminilitoris]|uniref:Uncharacterized protein n=1 Tax=Kangiella sediminilitoris TaxID=1144748 RepID=A0A1B3BA14_9GAMM|nr:hypothetical protein [Kangiella sediminilitoris]AOE49652.1 hypothetical protein KS2013_930 [Kangiella sediminilitoris]
MSRHKTFTQQLKNNSLAIIGLVIAVIALTYNTWRSSTSELNRNFRNAAFELILQLGELQSITNDLHFNAPDVKSQEWQRHYDKSLIEGWGNIALIEDLSALLPENFAEQATTLKSAWSFHHSKLGNRDTRSEEEISSQIKKLRELTREFIKELD